MDNPSETLRRFDPPWWRRYGAAIGLILLAAVLRQALTQTVGLVELPFIFFFPAIALAAWYSGLAPALLSLLVALVLANRFFLNPANEVTASVIFVVTSAPIVVALDRLRRAGDNMAAEIRRRQRVEVEQDHTRMMLHTTIASIGDGVIVTDAQGDITFLNHEAERLTGWKTREAAGQPLSEVFHILNEQTQERAENPVEQALRSGAVVGLANHTILVAKDGREIPIDDSAAPIRSGATVFGVVLVFRDVTEQRRGEQFRARLAAIVEFSGDAIITKDLNGIVRTWNAGAERILGYKAAEMVGHSITVIIPPERLDEETEIIGSLRKGLPYQRVETVRVSKDGRRIPVSISASPIKDSEGNVIGASKILHDISDIVAAREALARETQLLETTLRSIGDAVVITDARGDVTFLNREAERLTGWAQSEAAGKNLPEVFRIVNEETRHTVENPVDKVLRTGTVVGLANHTLLVSRDGAETPIDDSAAPIKPTSGGDLLGVVLVFRDFTARRQAERALRESEERFRLMADAAPVFIWVSDTNRQSTWFNQRWLDFVGRTMEQELGMGWAENVHPDDLADCLQIYVASFEARRPFTMTYRLRRSDGEYRWILDHGIPRLDPDGGFAGYIGSCIDITERKQAEDTLQRDARRKDEFLAVLSHELRNPLGAIRMAVYLLNEKETTNKSVQRVHTIIDRQTTQMTRLLDDLMDVSRISSGRISLKTERVDFTKAVTSASESVQPQIRAKKHAFIVDMPSVPIYVDADPVRLAQIVSNLLNNAARYTREGGRISLTVRREKNNAVVRVQDSGIGLSPEQMPHIFGMFTQVDRSAERGHGGLGVGLALSKQLVQLHGGSIEARSEGLGKGSEFIVRLPLADPPTPATSSGPAEVAPLSMKRVLIADDNIDSAMALSDLLALSGHDVHTVYDGLAAVETAKRVNPDVAILDIGMPKLDGYEVARRIRAEQLPMILIALTGWGQEQDRQQAREAGFDHHLTKPVDLAKLEELLQSSPQERH